MAIVFYIMGFLATLIGILWGASALASTLGAASTDGSVAAYAVLAAMFAVAPGLGTFSAGLVFFAIGGVLLRLDRIVENTTRRPAKARQEPFEGDMSRWSEKDRQRYRRDMERSSDR